MWHSNSKAEDKGQKQKAKARFLIGSATVSEAQKGRQPVLPDGLLLKVRVLPNSPHDLCHSCGQTKPPDHALQIDWDPKNRQAQPHLQQLNTLDVKVPLLSLIP